MEQMNPKISVEYLENAIVAILMDEKILEETDILALENSIMPLIETDSGINLVINFSNVEFLSSAVLGLLIRVSKKIYESAGQLKLYNIKPKILKIFRITRLDKVFDIYDQLDEALESLG